MAIIEIKIDTANIKEEELDRIISMLKALKNMGSYGTSNNVQEQDVKHLDAFSSFFNLSPQEQEENKEKESTEDKEGQESRNIDIEIIPY